MLEVAFYMFLAGCSDDMLQCEEIASPAVSYVSADACLQELSAAVQVARSDWPVTTGICRPSQLDRIAARPGWLPLPAEPASAAG